MSLRKIQKVALGAVTDDTGRITYSSDAPRLPDWGEQFLLTIMDEANVTSIKVTSTYRTPRQQATAMYNNAKSHGVQWSRDLYKGNKNAQLVIDVFESMQSQPSANVIDMMTNLIVSSGMVNSSLHMNIDKTVADIAPSSIPAAEQNAFFAALQSAKTAGRVGELIRPPKDPAFHVQLIESGVKQALQAAANLTESTDDEGNSSEGGGDTEGVGAGVIVGGAVAVGLVVWGISRVVKRKR